mgnify:CR=1 FL=1
MTDELNARIINISRKDILRKDGRFGTPRPLDSTELADP